MSTKIIADACSNHLGDKRIIEQMIKSASECGVDFIKFQAFKADNLTPEWMHRYDYYKSVELKDDDYPFIMDKCKQYGIKPMFTVFSVDMIPILLENGVQYCKIASPDADNIELIRICAKHFDEIIISTGMEFNNRYASFKYLYCVSRYPAPIEDIDFDKMQLFDGFSDHTQGITAAKKAIELGMEYIERHFTLGKWLPGKDHFVSSTPDEFKELCDYRDYKEMIPKYKNRWRKS